MNDFWSVFSVGALAGIAASLAFLFVLAAGMKFAEKHSETNKRKQLENALKELRKGDRDDV